jgi:putative addiction module component (TIGR02574 family)
MKKTDVTELLKLPAEERMRLLEVIWESLVTEPSGLAMSEAHCAVLDERLAEHERDPDEVVTRDEVLTEARRG